MGDLVATLPLELDASAELACTEAALLVLLDGARIDAGTLLLQGDGRLTTVASRGPCALGPVAGEADIERLVRDHGALAVPFVTALGERIAWFVVDGSHAARVDHDGLASAMPRAAALLEVQRLRARWNAVVRDHRALVDDASDGVFVTDCNLRILTVNRHGAEMIGRSPAELAGRPIADFLAPEETSLRRDELVAGVRTRTERRFRHADGSVRVLDVSAYRTSDGRLIGLARDVTARKDAEERLTQSEASFRALIEKSPDGIAVHAGGRVLYVNEAFVRLLGYAHRDEIIGLPVIELVHPDDRHLAGARIQAMHAGEPSVPFVEERLLHKSGAPVVAEIGAMRVVFHGQPALVAICRDVTEQRELMARLAQRERLASVGTLAASVAHEINNPLTYVMIHLENLARALAEAGTRGALPPGDSLPRLADAATAALAGVGRVAEIVRDLRTFARASDEREVLDLRMPLEAALNLANHELKHRARVVRDIGGAAFVLGSEGRLCQIFLNLLVNAAQALPERNTGQYVVTVRLRILGPMALVEIEDNGVGIPPALLARIFDPFVTTKGQGGSFGLGLAICRDLAAAMGGRIELSSKEGEGTRAQVFMPLVTAGAQGPRPAEPSIVPRPGARILVVDDEPAILGLVATMLAPRFEVVSLSSAVAAQELLTADRRFDLILCDVVMPLLSGIELHEWLRGRDAALADRTFFIAGGNLGEAGQQFADRDPGRFLPKPFTTEALHAFIDRTLARLGTETE